MEHYTGLQPKIILNSFVYVYMATNYKLCDFIVMGGKFILIKFYI